MKYFKPKSLTFWSAVVPMGLGLFVAFVPVHGMTEWAYSVDNLTGNVGPYALVNGGLVGLGLRAAIK